MYSYDERIKAVELYIKYGLRAATVIRELGYPDRHSLAMWLATWIREEFPEERPFCRAGSPLVNLSQKEREKAKHFSNFR